MNRGLLWRGILLLLQEANLVYHLCTSQVLRRKGILATLAPCLCPRVWPPLGRVTCLAAFCGAGAKPHSTFPYTPFLWGAAFPWIHLVHTGLSAKLSHVPRQFWPPINTSFQCFLSMVDCSTVDPLLKSSWNMLGSAGTWLHGRAQSITKTLVRQKILHGQVVLVLLQNAEE